jgi:hypothetical protein
VEQSWNRLWKYIAAGAGCIVLGLLSFESDAGVPLLKWIDLGVHESGHLATFWLPDVATAMAGSIAQIAVPLAIGTYFAARRRDLVGAALCFAWAGTSANAASVYIADAPTEALPLAGGGLHDWAFILGPDGFDAMESAGALASTVRGVGLAMVLVAVASCLAGPLLAARLPASGPAGPPDRL